MADTEMQGAALARDELCALAEQIQADAAELARRTALPPYDGQPYVFDGRAWVLLAAADVRPPTQEARAELDQLATEFPRPLDGLGTQVAAWIAEQDRLRPGLADAVATHLAILEDCDGLIREQAELDQGADVRPLAEEDASARWAKLFRDAGYGKEPAPPLATHYPGDGHPGCEGATGATAPDAPLDERLAVVLYHTDEPECQPYVEALRNVLILHAENAGTCVECSPGGWCASDDHGDGTAPWPCPTVRALAEPLVGRFDGVDLAPVPEPARELTEDEQLDDDVRPLGAGVEPGEHDWRYDRG